MSHFYTPWKRCRIYSAKDFGPFPVVYKFVCKYYYNKCVSNGHICHSNLHCDLWQQASHIFGKEIQSFSRDSLSLFPLLVNVMCFVLIGFVIKTSFQEHRKIMLLFVINSALLWRPWKLFNFQDPIPPLSVYVQNFSTRLTLDVQF